MAGEGIRTGNARSDDRRGRDLLIGLLVPTGPWIAPVIGVFRRAIVFLPSDGALVTLVDAPGRMEGRSLCHPEGFAALAVFAADRRTSGSDPLYCWDGRRLRPASGLDGPVLDFLDARIWDPRSGAFPPLSSESRSRARAFLNSLLVREEPPSIGLRLGAFEAGFQYLREREDFPACLVGFGPGTTPGGDDWLAGFLCARDLTVGVFGRGELKLREEIRSRWAGTTPAGRALLISAAEGVFPDFLHRVAREVLRAGSGDGLEREVQEALGHGASSGRDALEGFLEGLDEG